MTDSQRRNETAWDEKYTTLLQTLEDYQEEKENPRKQVVEMDLEELYVCPHPHRHSGCLDMDMHRSDDQQVQGTVQVAHRSVRAARVTLSRPHADQGA